MGCQRTWVALFVLAFLGAALPRESSAQFSGREIPSTSYHDTFALFYDGNYKDALDRFKDEWRGAVKTSQSRWIDSICYHTMIGECYYHTGKLDLALEQYTAALRLYLTFPDWMARVQFTAAIQPMAILDPARQAPWGTSVRGAKLGQYPKKMSISQGHYDISKELTSGGVVQKQMLVPIEAQEIVRCTALAIRRRAELLGPMSRQDPMNAELLAAFSQPVGPRNHWSQCWVDVEMGLALLAAGKDTEANSMLSRSIVAAGEYYHPLSATAVLELGKMAMVRGDYPNAAKYFVEASILGVFYPDLGIIEESLRYGARVHWMANQKGLYPPLTTATPWAKVKGWRQLRVSLLLSSAENAAMLHQTKEAAAILDDAHTTIARRTMGSGWIGARLSYLRALVLYQQRKVAAGDEALAAAVEYMQHGGLWLFSIAQVNARLLSNTLPPRAAMILYSEVLHDPRSTDWVNDPLESLSVLMTPHQASYENWFSAAIRQTVRETAVEGALDVAERMRRHRFFSTLKMGGRLQSLRWTLEAPAGMLDKQSLLHRQDLLAQFPAYEKLSQQAKTLRDRLNAKPLVAKDATALHEQTDLFAELGNVCAQQEAMLHEIALRREATVLAFPPLTPVKEIQKSLSEGQAILAFLAGGDELHAFLLNHDKQAHWQIKAPQQLHRQIVTFLRDIGNTEHKEIQIKDLTDIAWKRSAKQVLDSILAGSQADLSKKFAELIIVPDGDLWYVPFEALQVTVENKNYPLISRFQIRYAPTLSLAVPQGRERNSQPETAVVLGRFFPRDSELTTEAACEQFSKTIPKTVAISRLPLPAPSSLYRVRIGRLVVLDDLATDSGPYAWMPISLDKKKTPGNVLADWLALPWGGPEVVVLPGYHTVAESSLRRSGHTTPGSEMFLSVCALLSSGTRTILLSRWRTSGQNSIDLAREFTQELPDSSPADAWQRAVLLSANTRLNLDAEPRIKRTTEGEAPKANHPFFWASYMLIDPGVKPDTTEPEPKKPEAKANPPQNNPPTPEAKKVPKEADVLDGPMREEPPKTRGKSKKKAP